MAKKHAQASSSQESLWVATDFLDIHDNKSNKMKAERLEEIKLLFNPTIDAVIPRPFELVDWFREGWVCFYSYPFDIGLVLLFSKLVKDVLICMQVSPAQLMPFAWRDLAYLEAIEAKHHLGIDVNVVKYCYSLKNFYKSRFGFSNRLKDESLILNIDSINDRQWKHSYFFADKSSMEDEASYLLERWSSKGTFLYFVCLKNPFSFNK